MASGLHLPVTSVRASVLPVASVVLKVPQQCPSPVHLDSALHADAYKPAAGMLAAVTYQAFILVVKRSEPVVSAVVHAVLAASSKSQNPPVFYAATTASLTAYPYTHYGLVDNVEQSEINDFICESASVS